MEETAIIIGVVTHSLIMEVKPKTVIMEVILRTKIMEVGWLPTHTKERVVKQIIINHNNQLIHIHHRIITETT